MGNKQSILPEMYDCFAPESQRNPKTIAELWQEKESQNSQIKAYLESGKSLTPIQALELFGCFRLGARIHNLDPLHLWIKHEMITTEHGKRVAKYSKL